jgi:Flp pilus assembly protein protease CpaA
MGIGVSIFLIAVGAILTFAVHATVSGVSIQTIGVILMIAGALGLIVTMMIFGPRRRAGGVVEERVVDDRPAAY